MDILLTQPQPGAKSPDLGPQFVVLASESGYVGHWTGGVSDKDGPLLFWRRHLQQICVVIPLHPGFIQFS